jgi:hypothetical protein
VRRLQRASAQSKRKQFTSLLKRGPAPPPVYQGQYDPKALFGTLKVFAGIR